jgi:hypothetical protein
VFAAIWRKTLSRHLPPNPKKYILCVWFEPPLQLHHLAPFRQD